MPGYRVPFAQVDPTPETEVFDPGPVLARVVDEDLLDASDPGTAEGAVKTPWGQLGAERPEVDEVLLETPGAEVSARQVMLAIAARTLDVDRSSIEQAAGTLQEIDVGEPVLVVPLASMEDLQAAPEQADPSGLPGVEAEIGVAYTVTQTSPYVRIAARVWGDGPALTVLAAAAMHLVLAEGFRPTYPRTRVVAELLDEEGEAEIKVQAREAGAGPVVERVLVGGHVEPVDV